MSSVSDYKGQKNSKSELSNYGVVALTKNHLLYVKSQIMIRLVNMRGFGEVFILVSTYNMKLLGEMRSKSWYHSEDDRPGDAALNNNKTLS